MSKRIQSKENQTKLKAIFTLVTVILFLVIWTFTGLEKLINWQVSYKAFHNQPFPFSLADMLAYGIPITELLLAFALAAKPLRWWGLMGSVLLLSVFTTYVGLIWWNVFDRVPCNCAGFIEAMGWPGHFYFNSALLCLGIAALWMERVDGQMISNKNTIHEDKIS
ncbi:MauE/DoxX family redox-associated membrane protein [Echinicola rosea]|uniref:Methylamine utilisation protein MauE domain-containing protein n=1 Tax=Echinicola rosea TaxID=1807691 RepID=A0ABQ1V951_9BACT|nr:MauE/DoxX family redox-associated membrane protein [Echinicola rosea]GGF42577.1 hypothetical protein GCM10011339_33820 [Echinicola rosea]